MPDWILIFFRKNFLLKKSHVVIVHIPERYHKIPYYILLTSSSARLIYTSKKSALRNTEYTWTILSFFTPSQRKRRLMCLVVIEVYYIIADRILFFFRTRLPVEMWNASSFFHAQRNITDVSCIHPLYNISWPFLYELLSEFLFGSWCLIAPLLIDIFFHIQSLLVIVPHHHKKNRSLHNFLEVIDTYPLLKSWGNNKGVDFR